MGTQKSRYLTILITICAVFTLPLFLQFTLFDRGKDSSVSMQLIEKRLFKEIVTERNDLVSQPLIFSIRGGKYQDINYLDSSMTNWTAIKHLERIEALSVVYNKEGTTYFKNAALLENIKSGLKFWLDNTPRSGNWWFNEIGSGIQLSKILILLHKDITNDPVLDKGVNRISQLEYSKNDKSGMNLVWFSQIKLVTGLLKSDTNAVKESLSKIKMSINPSQNEGIQYDYSFHQHGSQIYSTGYGLQFLIDATFYAVLVKDTEYAFSDKEISTLSNFFLKGLRYFSRYGVLDYNASGRNFSRGIIPTKTSTIDIAKRLQILDPKRTASYKTFIDAITKAPYRPSFIGNRYFFSSDFMTHQRNGYYFSIKMTSDRTVGTEIINGENLKGGWMPYGSNFLIKDGTEYNDVFPLWDWTKIPGVTAINKLLAVKFSQREINQDFVAGVSDGMYGASAMILNKEGLKAHKAWFCFDDQIVVMGSGISADAPETINTGISQVAKQGPIEYSLNKVTNVLNSDSIKLVNPTWVAHNNVGYFFPDAVNLVLKGNSLSGRWADINKMRISDKKIIKKSLFTLYIPHGVKPVNQKFSYIIFPNLKNKLVLDGFSSKPSVLIVRNDNEIQAVTQDNLHLTEAVFYQSSSLKVNSSLSIMVDKPCLVLLKVINNKINISISDPSYKDNLISVTVNYNKKIYRTKAIFKANDISGITRFKTFQL